MHINLQSHTPAFDKALAAFEAGDILPRIWARDHTVWHPDPTEIADRLGWLDVHDRMRGEVPALAALREQLRDEGFTHALLLGMGGSSLAPEVFRKTFGVPPTGLDLAILDSTDPEAVRANTEALDPAKTLFLVSSKSGGTVETFSLFKYCYNLAVEALGRDKAGSRFIAITDPGSGLAATGEKYGFRAVFLNDPNIGGRYSALSHFGLVPAALLDIDLDQLLVRSSAASAAARSSESAAVRMGIALGVLAQEGRDKLTLVCSKGIESFGDWVEQLIAESTGKHGQGILPVVGERQGGSYGDDRVFAGLVLPGDVTTMRHLSAVEAVGHPMVRIDLEDIYDLGGQFFDLELATAIAGHVLGIQPFDQPNVESAKVLARKMVDQYHETGELPAGERAEFSVQAISAFIEGLPAGGYIAVQAYLAADDKMDQALFDFREALRQRTGAAVTVGYGPRFLHSTGQLHKGDGGNGRFIQLVTSPKTDLPIPDEAGEPASSMSFNTLKLAQALGDFQALRTANPPRLASSYELEHDPAVMISTVADQLIRM